MARSHAASSQQPVNVPGAKRINPRLRSVSPARADANYEIVHGTVVLADPDAPTKLAAYYPGEIIRLSGADADFMLARGIVTPVGTQGVLKTTMPDRAKAYQDQAGHGKDAEGTAKLVVVDVEAAATELYDVDSTHGKLGGLNGSGR